MIFYNDIEPNAVKVLNYQIERGSLPPGTVDSRSIEDLSGDELKNYTECHFFAGIGGFALGFKEAKLSGRVWTGGFPCQDLSVAGKRKGLAGSRSGLFFAFHRLIAECRPEWVILENVPGLLSSNAGMDFAIVLAGLTGVLCEVPKDGWGNAGIARGPVYNAAWRVLDAQYFGVPQRRRRVFIVGHLGTGSAAEVLFESEGFLWNPPPRRQKGKGFAAVAGTLSANGGGTERPAGQANELDFVIPDVSPTLGKESHSPTKSSSGQMLDFCIPDVAHSLRSSGVGNTNREDYDTYIPIGVDGSDVGYTLRASPSHSGDKGDGGVNTTMVAYGGGNTSGEINVSTALTAHGMRQDFDTETFIAFSGGNSSKSYGIAHDENVTPPVRAGASGTNQVPTIAFAQNQRSEVRDLGDKVGALSAEPGAQQQSYLAHREGVRRLMPVECERLQGFPDGWTGILSDGKRYEKLGNAVAVPVIEWLAKRIELVE